MSKHRSSKNWEVHDYVIMELKDWLESQGKYVVTNPGQEKNPDGSVKRDDESIYPDLVVRPSQGEKITELFEVETEDSVDSEEVEQWEIYEAGKESFYLIVPEGSIDRAKELIRERGFSIDGIGYYDTALNVSLPEGV
jgi:hypothetical protein